MKCKISIIVPILNEERNIASFFKEVTKYIEKEDYELIFIDDGSSDNTVLEIKKLASDNIHFISFSRNFGHQSAIKAGIDYAKGECVIMLDGDLQHPPSLIPKMLAKWREGFEVVYTIRKETKNISTFKKTSSSIFYKLLNFLSETKIESGTADFRLISRKALDSLNSLNDQEFFFRGIIPWIGYKQTAIEYTAQDRKFGASSFTLKKMFKLAIVGITSNSTKPLYISFLVGTILSSLTFSYALYAIFISIFTNKAIDGWTSLIVSILFLGGVQLLGIGILGIYISKIFHQTKKRPHYIINETSIN
jgi:dolichol-phosphate mannosyltransferase